MRPLWVVVFLALPAIASAGPVETWECVDGSDYEWKNILAVATVDSGRTSGTITVAGVTHRTAFHVEGFMRRWDFGERQGGGYRYSFQMQPDGTALYYDFRDAEQLSRASVVMECRQTGSKKRD